MDRVGKREEEEQGIRRGVETPEGKKKKNDNLSISTLGKKKKEKKKGKRISPNCNIR